MRALRCLRIRVVVATMLIMTLCLAIACGGTGDEGPGPQAPTQPTANPTHVSTNTPTAAPTNTPMPVPPSVLTPVLVTTAASTPTPTETSPYKGTIVLVVQDWNGQLVTTAVAQILLEQVIGYEVELKFAPADSAPLFIGLESGDFHFVCCNWPSYSFSLLDEYVNPGGKESVERLGPVGIVGRVGWYTPSYVVEGPDAPAPGLDSWDELDQFKSVFATADTGESGRLLGVTRAWDDRSQERLDAMGADYHVVFAGSETAALSEIDAAFNRGDPILTYLWEPHWAHAKYDLVRIKMPPLTKDCYPAGNAYDFICGWPEDEVAKLVWPGLKDEFPEAYKFLYNFQMTNKQQNEMVLNVTENHLTPREAAQAWIDANEDIWSVWIP